MKTVTSDLILHVPSYVFRYAEVLVLVMFVLLALLWLTREPKFIPGWGHIFRTEEGGKR